ncbi:MAG: corrinoid protein [Candidatus Bathyarchaeota archaeon]|nr:MAG: corrinoid protein [Candidatus Bathyarchaeota archaeon]
MENDILQSLTKAVVNYEVEDAVSAAKRALEAGVDPVVAIEEGLAKGVRIVGDRFGAEEVFLPELMVAVEAMKQAMVILKPAITATSQAKKALGRVMIGTIEGDIHDIGKSMVSAMLTVAGFEVVDLGTDVSVAKFIAKVRELEPDIVGMSALMTTTMLRMKDVIEGLRKERLREKVKVVIGGVPTSLEWAKEIGADGHGWNALEAVEVAKRLLQRE